MEQCWFAGLGIVAVVFGHSLQRHTKSWLKKNGFVNWYFLNYGNVQASRPHFSPFFGPIFFCVIIILYKVIFFLPNSNKRKSLMDRIGGSHEEHFSLPSLCWQPGEALALLSCARKALCVYVVVVVIVISMNVCQQCDRWSTQVSASRSAMLPEALLAWTAGTQQVLPQQVPYHIHVWSQIMGTKTQWGHVELWQMKAFWILSGCRHS